MNKAQKGNESLINSNPEKLLAVSQEMANAVDNENEAKSYFVKALALYMTREESSLANKEKELLSDIYVKFAEAYEKIGDIKKAGIYWKKAVELGDSRAHMIVNPYTYMVGLAFVFLITLLEDGLLFAVLVMLLIVLYNWSCVKFRRANFSKTKARFIAGFVFIWLLGVVCELLGIQ